MKKFLRELKYFVWALNGQVGLGLHSSARQKATVLITYYSPARMKHINHQLRNILKCDFVEKVILSNHNPEIRIDSLVAVRDKRVTIINQSVRRGCGYRWLVAKEYSPEYLIVVDDDILIFPRQLKQLFESLIAEPEIPHGYAGMVRHENDFIEYRENEDRSVDYICEIYAITGEQLRRYTELRAKIATDASLINSVDFATDFMLVSQTGRGDPKIHKAGRLFRCPTYNEAGVAVHKAHDFDKSIPRVASALRNFVPEQQRVQFELSGGIYDRN